jgi:hypothetical protein
MDQKDAIYLLCKVINKKTSQESLRAELESLSQENWKELLDHAIHLDLTLILYKHINMLKHNEIIPLSIQESLYEAYLKATARNMRI